MESGPTEHPLRGEEEEKSGGHHGEGHRDSVGTGQVFRGLEAEDESEAGNHQSEIDLRHVNLATLVFRGVFDEESRHVAQLNGVHRQGVGPGDERLGGDDRRGSGQNHQRVERPLRAELIEGIESRCRGNFGLG